MGRENINRGLKYEKVLSGIVTIIFNPQNNSISINTLEYLTSTESIVRDTCAHYISGLSEPPGSVRTPNNYQKCLKECKGHKLTDLCKIYIPLSKLLD